MKLYIIAGEASGDLHGSNLLKAIKSVAPDTQCRVWGGDMMQAAGGELVKHYRDLAFMGFVEVIANLRTIMRNIAFCKEDITRFQPDVVVFIDYPGFNLRIAKWLRQEVNAGRLASKSVYYIAPQIWAWHTSRVHGIKRYLDKVLVILPFEKAFYEKYGVHCEFVGHPLLDVLQPVTAVAKSAQKTIALLPGSRFQEVKRILPIMLSVIPKFIDYQFIIAASSTIPLSVYEAITAPYGNVAIVTGDTYGVLRRADAALVKSGTSTLETALIGIPQVVCYTGNRLSFEIAKRLIKIGYISLVNLIADAPVVEELIQDNFNTDTLEKALQSILSPERAQQMQADYHSIRATLGEEGASLRAANAILSFA
jgi:lipid-A-disaccharide synthase